MVPLWVYLTTVMVLLTTQIVPGVLLVRRNLALHDALTMREVLLGHRLPASVFGDHVLMGGSLMLPDAAGNFVEISCTTPTMITVRHIDR